MAAPGTLTIDLSPEAAQLVQRAVQAGDFPDAKTAVEAAVHAQAAQGGDFCGYTPEEIDRAIDEADASGPGTMSLDDIMREGFRRAGVSYPNA